MCDVISWIKWYFWTVRRCQHERGPGQIVDLGMAKVWRCSKCSKVLEHT